ncbi:MAG TPA: hypothetical protein DCP92_24745 [Nitrospiraceae bacterium]|jgi:hypothetical protein|nr:hypothetical protein [Nitrospiraceae bacterium]
MDSDKTNNIPPELEKEYEEWIKKRLTIIECCMLNNIVPAEFISIALGIMSIEYKRNGYSYELFLGMINTATKTIADAWEKI